MSTYWMQEQSLVQSHVQHVTHTKWTHCGCSQQIMSTWNRCSNLLLPGYLKHTQTMYIYTYIWNMLMYWHWILCTNKSWFQHDFIHQWIWNFLDIAEEKKNVKLSQMLILAMVAKINARNHCLPSCFKFAVKKDVTLS